MTTFLYILAVLIGSYTIANTLYLAVWVIAGQFGGTDDLRGDSPKRPSARRIAVLIPAYKEDAVILESVEANLSQNYPRSCFDLIVIADSFQPKTLVELSRLPVRVIEVGFEVPTVTKALQAALAELPAYGYDIVVVSDADNHMAPDFLMRINQAFAEGWRAVQGHRVAKNLNTSVAVLDAISEEINNHIFRKGHRALGLSALPIGSGMAFDFALFKFHMSYMDTVSAYDKELGMRLTRDGVRIGYLEEALIYDEKVQNPATFEHQRTRWVAAQLGQAQLHFKPGITALLKGNIDYAVKMLQNLMLPRILLLGIYSIGMAVGVLTNTPWLWELMGGQLLVLVLLLALALPGYMRRLIGLKELLMVPILFLRFTRSVINFRRASKQFLHTPHGTKADVVDQATNNVPY